MSDGFMSPFDDPNFDLNAWYTRSPDEIRQAKEAQAYQAWRNLSPVGMSDEERAASHGDAVGADPNPGAADANAAGEDASARTPRPLPAVGPGAKMLLDKIGAAEVPDAPTHGDPAGYNQPYNYGKGGPPLSKKLTAMTLDEIDAHQVAMQQAHQSDAMGRYQIQREKMLETRRKYGLTGQELFTPDMQDRIGRDLMRRHGYDSYCAGALPFSDLHHGFSREWASVESPEGGSHYGQPVRLPSDELRSAVDQACHVDRAQSSGT
ncbi:MAG: hypothetical protein JWP73_1860 [Phenylobacterium sp.]|nr:hypothetical protein [Phenylobacterium sp.]